jgi:hypothetical protein
MGSSEWEKTNTIHRNFRRSSQYEYDSHHLRRLVNPGESETHTCADLENRSFEIETLCGQTSFHTDVRFSPFETVRSKIGRNGAEKWRRYKYCGVQYVHSDGEAS